MPNWRRTSENPNRGDHEGADEKNGVCLPYEACLSRTLITEAFRFHRSGSYYDFNNILNSSPRRLFLQPKAINVGELGGDVLAVFLGGLEAGLLHCLQRFFVETGAAALCDLHLCHFPVRVDLNS